MKRGAKLSNVLKDAERLRLSFERYGLSGGTIRFFRKVIYDHYRREGRDLPWRKTRSPYRILVSEVMLQQTRVDRVLRKYPQFIEAFPDLRSLAVAPLKEVLGAWQGLGYNRRAMGLKAIALEAAKSGKGRMPVDSDALRDLPGIGAYTASALRCFAHGRAEPMIETNIRSVFIHFFFHGKTGVSDREIMPLVSRTLDKKDPRKWNYALMDYGVMLKKETSNPGKRSLHYQRQSPFEGSGRQLRGKILKILLAGSRLRQDDLVGQTGADAPRVEAALEGLVRDGLLIKKEGVFNIP